MRRILCAWLPRFSTERLLRTRPADVQPDDLLVLVAPRKGGNRLTAVATPAEAAGLRAGMLLTDATAIVPELRAMPHDAREEAAHLRRLALWCRRYTPLAAVDGTDGIWLDMTGAAHLFGGEANLLKDIRRRFAAAGYTCRAAMASTHAAAWGMARFAPSRLSILPQGEERVRLSPLPVRALGIEEDKAARLDRLGLKTIGQLFALPRANLRARFGRDLNDRLDQITGLKGEGLTSLAYDPVYQQRLDFHEPMTTFDAILEAARLLIDPVTARLRSDGKGAKRFTLRLFDTQGDIVAVSLALAQSSHAADHVLGLLRERLRILEGRFRGDLAFDAAMLQASRVEAMSLTQAVLASDAARSTTGGQALARLLDRLRARLGDDAVTRFAFAQSYMPERAAVIRPEASQTAFQAAASRPLLLLPQPEEIAAMAELPDYPPRRFTWRRRHHRVVKAEGPERIEPEWWRGAVKARCARDYYMVEDEEGHRFWLYREGIYTPEKERPRWFLHGLFP